MDRFRNLSRAVRGSILRFLSVRERAKSAQVARHWRDETWKTPTPIVVVDDPRMLLADGKTSRQMLDQFDESIISLDVRDNLRPSCGTAEQMDRLLDKRRARLEALRFHARFLGDYLRPKQFQASWPRLVELELTMSGAILAADSSRMLRPLRALLTCDGAASLPVLETMRIKAPYVTFCCDHEMAKFLAWWPTHTTLVQFELTDLWLHVAMSRTTPVAPFRLSWEPKSVNNDLAHVAPAPIPTLVLPELHVFAPWHGQAHVLDVSDTLDVDTYWRYLVDKTWRLTRRVKCLRLRTNEMMWAAQQLFRELVQLLDQAGSLARTVELTAQWTTWRPLYVERLESLFGIAAQVGGLECFHVMLDVAPVPFVHGVDGVVGLDRDAAKARLESAAACGNGRITIVSRVEAKKAM